MITNVDLKYLNIAELISKQSNYKRIHIGVVVVNKNKIISIGCNKTKTHLIQKQYNEKYLSYKKVKGDYLHAEIDALIKIHNNLSIGSTMYIFRRGNDNLYRISKPCKACINCIKDYGVKRIVYTIENGIKESYL